MTATRWPNGNAFPLPVGTNANTIVVEGYYDVTNPLNGPGNGRWRIHVEVDPLNANSVIQTASQWDGTVPREFIRRRSAAGVWDIWYDPAAISNAPDIDITARADGKLLVYNQATGKHIYSYASPASNEADIRDFASGPLVEYNGTPGSGTDITPFLNAALDAVFLRRGNRGTVVIPGGYYRMATGVDSAKWAGHFIRGQGVLQTHLIYDNNAGTMFWATGKSSNIAGLGENRPGGGLRDVNLIIGNGLGATTSAALRLWGYDTTTNATRAIQPHSTEFRNITVRRWGSNVDSWGTSLSGNGTDANGAGGGVLGIREVILENIRSFASNGLAMELYSTVEWKLKNIASYGVTGTGMTIQNAGGGGPDHSNMTLDDINCSGQLIMFNLKGRTCVNASCANLAVNGTSDYVSGFIRAQTLNGGAVGTPHAPSAMGNRCSVYITS